MLLGHRVATHYRSGQSQVLWENVAVNFFLIQFWPVQSVIHVSMAELSRLYIFFPLYQESGILLCVKWPAW